jgi:hypothetical protein
MAKVPLAGTQYVPGVTENEILSEVRRLLAIQAEQKLEEHGTASVESLRVAGH